MNNVPIQYLGRTYTKIFSIVYPKFNLTWCPISFLATQLPISQKCGAV